VEAGGYTVFPNLGISVKPVMGSAIFWYTFLTEQHHQDLQVKECPVVLGNKWGNISKRAIMFISILKSRLRLNTHVFAVIS
jgi:hypothetical protein